MWQQTEGLEIRVPLKIHISLQYCVAHKKYFLTYQLYDASIFFVLALSCLEIRIFRGAHKKQTRNLLFEYKTLVVFID